MAPEADPKQDRPEDSGMEALVRALRVSFNLLVAAMVCALLYFVWSSLFVVESDEVGIILRFGRIVTKDGNAVLTNRTYFSYPQPIDEKIVLPARNKSQKLSSDAFWYDLDKEGKAPRTLQPGVHGYTLSGDMNIVHSKWTLYYTIDDPVSYALRFSDATQRDRFLIRLLNNAVTRATAGQPIDSTWRSKDETLRQNVRRILVGKIEQLRLGISVERLDYVPSPPRQVKQQFELVTQAEERKRQAIADARGAAQKELSEASVNAAKIVADANTAKAAKTASASADAEVFKELYAQYRKNPGVFKRLYYEERMKRIFSGLDEKFVIDRRKQRQIRLELNPEPRKKAVGPGN